MVGILLSLLYWEMVILSGFIGAIFTSLINVGASGDKSFFRNITKARSRCESCEKALVWWELIPVLGWLILRGRCSKCGKPIAAFHFISEIFVFISFALGFIWLGDVSPTLFAYWIFVLALYLFSAYDIKKGIVPNKYLFPAVGVVLLIRISGVFTGEYNLVQLLVYLASGVIYFLFFAITNFMTLKGLFPGVKKGRQGFGWGDAKFAFFIGIVLGPLSTFVCLWISVFAGAMVGAILLLVNKIKVKKLPFAPFMSLGAVVAFVKGLEIFEYFRSLLFI